MSTQPFNATVHPRSGDGKFTETHRNEAPAGTDLLAGAMPDADRPEPTHPLATDLAALLAEQGTTIEVTDAGENYFTFTDVASGLAYDVRTAPSGRAYAVVSETTDVRTEVFSLTGAGLDGDVPRRIAKDFAEVKAVAEDITRSAVGAQWLALSDGVRNAPGLAIVDTRAGTVSVGDVVVGPYRSTLTGPGTTSPSLALVLTDETAGGGSEYSVMVDAGRSDGRALRLLDSKDNPVDPDEADAVVGRAERGLSTAGLDVRSVFDAMRTGTAGTS